MNTSPVSSEPADYELRYQSLFHAGRAYAFPCDAEGHVDIDALSDHARGNYFYARTVVGRELSMPSVIPSVAHHGRVARPQPVGARSGEPR